MRLRLSLRTMFEAIFLVIRQGEPLSKRLVGQGYIDTNIAAMLITRPYGQLESYL